MIIGINLLFLLPNKVGGSEPYTRGLLSSLVKYDRKNKYVLFCNRENINTFKESSNLKLVKVPINASNKPLRLLYEQFIFPIFIRKYKLDLLHSMGYISPFYVPTKSIVNIFDLNWYYHPEDFSFLERLVWKFMVTNSARFADALTTSSFSSKKSIQRMLNTDKPIKVIYMGIPYMEDPLPKSSLFKFGVRLPYLFSLSAAYPHKNVLGLLKVFKTVRDKGYHINLVIAGLGGRAEGDIKRFIKDNSLESQVNILGYVDNNVLSALYKYAKAFIFLSYYEGFGVPILESFRFGLPVISSNSFSLEEVVGDGGKLFDPDDHENISAEIIKTISNSNYHKMLSLKSKKRAKQFNWKDKAEKLVKFYEETANNV